jgi:hypothetical protein
LRAEEAVDWRGEQVVDWGVATHLRFLLLHGHRKNMRIKALKLTSIAPSHCRPAFLGPAFMDPSRNATGERINYRIERLKHKARLKNHCVI